MGIYNDEYMFHTGIKGMKWGKRAVSNIKEGIGAQNQASKDMLRHPIHSTAAQLSMLKNHPLKTIVGGTKVLKELNSNVKNRVDNRQSEIKTNVKNYKDHYNKSMVMFEKSDAQYAKAKELRKTIGKNSVSRAINSLKNKTPEAKTYNKAMDKAGNMSDNASEHFAKTQELYKTTGKNRIGAIINNIKY